MARFAKTQTVIVNIKCSVSEAWTLADITSVIKEIIATLTLHALGVFL